MVIKPRHALFSWKGWRGLCFCVLPPAQNVFPSSRRGGACPSRWFPEGFHFERRISPCGARFFPSDGKETKGSPGETHIAVGNKFPPAPVRSPPVPRLREIPLYLSAKFPARKIWFQVCFRPGHWALVRHKISSCAISLLRLVLTSRGRGCGIGGASIGIAPNTENGRAGVPHLRR